jgi:hypothetical protein
VNNLYFQLSLHALDVVLHASVLDFAAHFQQHLSFGVLLFSLFLGIKNLSKTLTTHLKT